MHALQNGLSNELKDSLTHADIPENIVDFVKMCSERDLQIRARLAAKKSGRWDGSRKSDNASNTTSAPNVSPAGTVAGYHGPAPMDLSPVNGRKNKPEERKRRREGGLCMYCGDARHFAASCPRKLKAASGQVEINPFNEDIGKGKHNQDQGKGMKVEAGKV
jgi:hypothetical protein